jgi:hypothetical protein
VPAGPLAADLFEVRAGYVAVECVLRAPPDLGGAAGAFQVSLGWAHDCVVEGQQWLGDSIGRPVPFECLGLVRDEPGVVQDAQWVCEVGGPALQVVGNAAAGGVALGDRREYCVVSWMSGSSARM